MKTSTASLVAGLVLLVVCLYGGFVSQDDCGPAFAVKNTEYCTSTHSTPTGLILIGVAGLVLVATGLVLRAKR